MPEERKLVTVLFADIVGSTTMTVSADAEVVRARLAELFARTRRILVDHGATVEKFIGDEVMAVFGVPLAHEDDPERAIRAALALRAEFASPGRGPIGALELRVGISTGEVVAGSAEAREFLVTGQAVNFAARLEKACAPDEVLVGPLTRRLTAAIARYGATRRVAAKGFGEIEAWPLEGIGHDSAGGRGTAAPFVGRERELALLGSLWEHTVVSGRPYLVTLIGEAGIGKTRVAEEVLARARPSYVARARCTPYGEGIGLRPIDEIVGPTADADLDAAVRFRKHLEARASSGPVAVVLEDIHWADPGLLDAIEEAVDRARGPIFVLCLARDDLLASRPRWGGGRANAASLGLGPLSVAAVRELVGRLGGEALTAGAADYVVEHAEGNPLFVHEYVRMLREAGDAAASIPPTLHALLAARLDRLPRDERELLRRASVVGRVFGRDALAVLDLDPLRIDPSIDDAVARELLVAADPAVTHRHWTFVHAVVRDVAYASLPKTERTTYHDRLSRWLESAAGDRAVIAYHAERAYENAAELMSDAAPDLAARAFEMLRRAGASASDAHETLSLDERALRVAGAAHADDESVHELRARAVMARLRLYGTADAVADMDALLTHVPDRRASETLVQLLVWKASVVVLDDPAAAERILADASRVASTLGDERLRTYVRWASAEPVAAAGDRTRERAILADTLAAIPRGQWTSLRVSCLADLLANALAVGDVTAATASAHDLDASLATVETLGSRFRAIEATARAALAAADRARATERAAEADAIARDLASPWALARGALARAACLADAGQASAAVSVLREALASEELARRTTMRGVVTELRCALATTLAQSGDLDGGAKQLEDAKRSAPVADARVRAHLDRADAAVRELARR